MVSLSNAMSYSKLDRTLVTVISVWYSSVIRKVCLKSLMRAFWENMGARRYILWDNMVDRRYIFWENMVDRRYIFWENMVDRRYIFWENMGARQYIFWDNMVDRRYIFWKNMVDRRYIFWENMGARRYIFWEKRVAQRWSCILRNHGYSHGGEQAVAIINQILCATWTHSSVAVILLPSRYRRIWFKRLTLIRRPYTCAETCTTFYPMSKNILQSLRWQRPNYFNVWQLGILVNRSIPVDNLNLLYHVTVWALKWKEIFNYKNQGAITSEEQIDKVISIARWAARLLRAYI